MMKNTALSIVVLCILLTTAWTARADDFLVWSQLGVDAKIDWFRIHATEELRVDTDGPVEEFTELKVGPSFGFGEFLVGFRHIYSESQDWRPEERLLFDLQLKLGDGPLRLDNRLRWEARFRSDGYRNRIRDRVRLRYRVIKPLDLFLYDEVLTSEGILGENRLSAGLSWTATSWLKADLFYVWQVKSLTSNQVLGISVRFQI